jgi:hypothetical protein
VITRLAIFANLLVAAVFVFAAFACWVTGWFMRRPEVRAQIQAKFDRYA